MDVSLIMVGRAYAHEYAPDEIAQFFVSEQYPERFSAAFRQAATYVPSTSKDPIAPLAAANGDKVTRKVPGSFYEFITHRREFDKVARRWTTDLRFDAGNAQGIFETTADAANIPPDNATKK